MKRLKAVTAFMLALTFLAAPASTLAAEKKEKVKPYALKTCLVSDEELGSMGDPYVFVHEGREVKLCCKSCQKDFKKDTKKFVKKMEDAEKKAAKK